MLEIKDMSIYIYPRYLIKDFSLTLNKGDKLAIIGEEGNGKSTLLKSILGLCDYANITGNINSFGNHIGYLEQSLSKEFYENKVKEYLFKDEEDYYSKVSNLYYYLNVLKLDEDILNNIMKNLSGGEKVKVSILKLLLDDVDILFLDEPTNDLDIETLEWLEEFINKVNKPIIYVSHDETLLANTANMILHLEQLKNKTECRHTILKSGYDEYVEKRIRSIEKQTQVAKSERRDFQKKQDKLNRVMQKVEHQQNIISRGDPHGAQLLKKKMHSLKSQEKKINKLDLTELPIVEEQINFFFDVDALPNSKIIFNLDLLELKVQNKVLAKNIKLDVVGNEHICIIGKNGVGKSTLIKLIYDNLKNRNDIKVGYMPQLYEDILFGYESVLDYVSNGKSKDEITRVRNHLGNMNFTRDEMVGKIENLSNGTKAKLLLAKLVVDECNVLILDEPTRNVSPLSNPVIRKVLSEFNGCIISVSHDRKYLDEVIDTIYILTENGLTKI